MKNLLKQLALPVTLTIAFTATSVSAVSFITPAATPGKEYSNFKDKNAPWVLDPLQNLGWDGFGANSDATDYSGTLSPIEECEVDALANSVDAYFQNVVHDMPDAGMVVSLTGENFIRSHDTAGGTGIWATKDEVRGAPVHSKNADDVDGLEIWGLDDDADHFSLSGDISKLGGTSVFYHDKMGGITTPYISHAALLSAVNGFLHADLQEIDVDAMMLQDLGDHSSFDAIDTLLFSLAPTGPLDGGEIFVLSPALGISFLSHGGVLWDTANDVMGTFGSTVENINALEAVKVVPEPMTCGLLALGAAAIRKRRRA